MKNKLRTGKNTLFLDDIHIMRNFYTLHHFKIKKLTNVDSERRSEKKIIYDNINFGQNKVQSDLNFDL